MSRIYSLAYLSSHRCTPPEAVRVAAANGYQFVGLRLWPNAPGAPQQHLLNQPEVLTATQAAMADTGVLHALQSPFFFPELVMLRQILAGILDPPQAVAVGKAFGVWRRRQYRWCRCCCC